MRVSASFCDVRGHDLMALLWSFPRRPSARFDYVWPECLVAKQSHAEWHHFTAGASRSVGWSRDAGLKEGEGEGDEMKSWMWWYDHETLHQTPGHIKETSPGTRTACASASTSPASRLSRTCSTGKRIFITLTC